MNQNSISRHHKISKGRTKTLPKTRNIKTLPIDHIFFIWFTYVKKKKKRNVVTDLHPPKQKKLPLPLTCMTPCFLTLSLSPVSAFRRNHHIISFSSLRNSFGLFNAAGYVSIVNIKTSHNQTWITADLAWSRLLTRDYTGRLPFMNSALIEAYNYCGWTEVRKWLYMPGQKFLVASVSAPTTRSSSSTFAARTDASRGDNRGKIAAEWRRAVIYIILSSEVWLWLWIFTIIVIKIKHFLKV